MRRRVAVTGMGVVSPIGSTIESFGESLFAGRSGVGPVTLFDPAELPTRIAAEVDLPPVDCEFRDRKIDFALEAAAQAAASAPEDPEGAGLSLALGLELFSLEDLVALDRPGFRLPDSLRDRLQLLQTPSDLCVHLICHRYGLATPPLTHISACAAGNDAVGTAYRLVASGRREWMLAGGSDSMVNPMGLAGFAKIQALSTRNDEPERASRPFDARRDGFVLGEGAAMLVLEPLELALARGARIHAEIVGYGNSFDADAISRPHPEGRGAFQAMSRALEEAGIGPAAIGCVNAHGTSTPLNDMVETRALRALLGERIGEVPVTAPKSMFGHLIAAAGAVEAVAAILALEAGAVPPTINLTEPDPECDLDHVSPTTRSHEHEYVLSNSFGFGGQNSSLVLRRCDAAR